jgi:O-antigen/teichoic acid export membrane protein
VSSFYQPAEFAIYAVGAVEIPVVTVIGSAVSSVLIPRFSSHFVAGEGAQIAPIWRESIRKTALLVMPIFAFLMVFAEPFIVLFYGANYAESVGIFRVYLLLLPLRVASYGMVLQAIGRTRPILRGSLYYLLGNAGLNLALVGPLGLVGPAWATVIATFLLAGYLLVHVSRELAAPITTLLPWRSIARVLLVALLAGGVCLPILLWDSPDIVRLLTAAPMYFVVFGAIALASKTLTSDDLDLTLRWISRRVFRHGSA